MNDVLNNKPNSRKNLSLENNYFDTVDEWRDTVNNMMENEIAKRDALLNQQVGEFDNIVMQANQQRAITAHQRDVAFLSLFKNASKNPYGESDPALNEACGAAFGIPGFSGMRMVNDGPAAGNFAVYQSVKNQDGSIASKPVMLINPVMMAQVSHRLRNEGYNTTDVQALSNTAWNLGKMKYNLTDSQMSNLGFQNPNGPVVVGETTDGKATARLMGMKGDNRSTISVYSNRDGGMTRTVNGHTGEDTGYVPSDPVRYAREMAGQWRQIAVGPSNENGGGYNEKYTDDNGNEKTRYVPKNTSQVRTYENSATGEIVRVKDGETPPWQRGGASERERIAQMREDERSKRAEADRLSKEKRAQAYADERKALREQNSILSRMRMLGSQRDKELDPKKKEEIQKQIDELEKGLRDVPDPDAEEKSGTNTLSTAGSATGAVVGRKNPVIPSSGGASKEVKDDAESKRRATNGKAGNARIATGEQVGNDQDANTVSDNNDSSFTEDEINAKIKEIRNTTNKKNVTREEAIEELESDKQFNESVKASAKKVGKKVGRALHSAVMYAGDYLTGQNKKDAPYPDFLKDDDTVRNDGTKKGNGYLGILKLPNGKDATEYSVGVKIDGKEIDIPTLVPTLTKEEVSQMVNDIIPNNKSVPDSIMNKAISHAKKRIASGKSVFAESGEYDKNKS